MMLFSELICGSVNRGRACSEFETLFDLLFEELILEFLLSEDLSAFLTSSNQIRHHLLCRAERQIFKYFESFLSEASSHLIREPSQLSEPNSFALSETVLINEVDGFIAGEIVV